jgi:predicted small secreted protein
MKGYFPFIFPYFCQGNSYFMMKKILVLLFVPLVVHVFTGCNKSAGFQKDVEQVADGMCRIMEVMNKLQKADPNDSAGIAKLQKEKQRLETEMIRINEAFRENYKEKFSDASFLKEYSREMRKAILQCPHLSNEDRKRFEKEPE